MILKAFLAAGAVLLSLPVQAEPVNGDLCLPMEGWAVVARWNIGAGARSVREGWFRKEYNDGGWDKRKAGDTLPASGDGTWLRNSFRGRSKGSPDARALFSGLPGGALVFLNGVEVNGAVNGEEVPIAAQYRKGTNIFSVFYAGHGADAVQVPAVAITGLSGTGRPKKPSVLKTWRVRTEKVEKVIPDSWLRAPGSMGWKIRSSSIPSLCRGWLPPGPVCLKAGIDVPYYWRGRTVSLFLHDFPGEPAVYLNGKLLEERLASSGRFDAGKILKFDGRDTLCLVYPGNPPCEPGRDGRWAMAALRWEGGVRLPQFPSGSTIFTDFSGGAFQEGARQALRYVSGLIALSSTGYQLEWSTASSPGQSLAVAFRPAGYSTGLVACWSASRYSSADISRAEGNMFARVAEFRRNSSASWWVVTPPTVGRKPRLPANERLGAANRKFMAKAEEARLKVVPLFDVMRSALKRQRRWPAQVEWSSDGGELTPHGSYFMALIILDTFSMP